MGREEEEEMGEVEDLKGKVEKLERANARLCMEINEADRTPRTPVRRFMPPRYCPGCGEDVAACGE